MNLSRRGLVADFDWVCRLMPTDCTIFINDTPNQNQQIKDEAEYRKLVHIKSPFTEL